MTAILWTRLDRPGHEAARLERRRIMWQLGGSAVFAEAAAPVLLHYEVICDDGWYTRRASVKGFVGKRRINLRIEVDRERQWTLNRIPQPAVAGCIDLDLNFSPSTNVLPIRRLALAVGEEATVNAAWLRFPSFELETLPQVYRRIGPELYEYESGGGGFKAELHVNEHGFPIDYAGVWRMEAM